MKTSTNVRRVLLSYGLVSLLALCVLGIASGVGAAAAGLEVTISVFSGRPDPRYQVLDAKQLDEIRARIARATASAKPPDGGVIPAILGYRGVTLENAGKLAGLPAQISVFNGVIELGAEQKTFVLDKERALERYLLDLALAQRAIDAKLHAKILARW